jgi:hypothetical protein
MTPRRAYDAIMQQGLYNFNASDPVHVVRNQIRRHCSGISQAGSASEKHFVQHANGQYYTVSAQDLAAAPRDNGASGRRIPSHSSPPSRGGASEKGTIIEAIRLVMAGHVKPMTVQQVYDGIIEGGLYSFRATEPLHVVRSQLRRHALGLDFPSASELKHFELRRGNRYSVLEKPVRRRLQMAQIGLPSKSLRAPSGDDVRNPIIRSVPTREQVFVSYCQKDAQWMQRLQIHLKPLERLGVISRWDDSNIRPGDKWREEIAAALGRARVAVLLVSADFLASDFITENELPPLLSAAASDGVMILPLILSPCRFEKSVGLSQYQAVNSPKRPLIALGRAKREELFVKVADAIESALYPA